MGDRDLGSKVIFSVDLESDLRALPGGNRRIFVATEEVVNRLWVEEEALWAGIPRVVLPPGEENKKLSSVTAIWEFLCREGADRSSLLINIGGGMLTDLGGFAASTFKRGIGFVNIPTTLLAQVDASVGGKTGFNLLGLKNEIGTFAEPEAVVIHTSFLKTLDRENILSGYAEMIKHGLIFSPGHLAELRAFDTGHVDYSRLQQLIRHSVAIKEHFVTGDPREKSIRKALNFGHTIGHALESLSLDNRLPGSFYPENREQGKGVPEKGPKGLPVPVLHGYAVAWGMVAELFLSTVVCGFPPEDAHHISRWIKTLYGPPPLERSQFESLFEKMVHDKKNETGRMNLTLLAAPGEYRINQDCGKRILLEAMEYLLDI